MGAGLARGLDHSDSARFAFLLATPIILAAGLFKLPDLLGHNGDGVRGQALVACIAAAITAVFTVGFLVKYFKTRTLIPFAIYCVVFGTFMIVYTQVTLVARGGRRRVRGRPPGCAGRRHACGALARVRHDWARCRCRKRPRRCSKPAATRGTRSGC